MTRSKRDEWEGTYERMRALFAFLGLPMGRLRFNWSSPRKDGAELRINPMTGRCTVLSWMESPHNGDYHDARTEILPEEESRQAVSAVMKDLEAKAVKKILDEDREEREREEMTRVRRRLDRALSRISRGASGRTGGGRQSRAFPSRSGRT